MGLTVAEVGGDFSVTVIGAEDTRPLGPWVIVSTAGWGFGQQLEIGHRLRTVAHRCSDTVVSSVTTTNDDDVLALGANVVVILQLRVEKRLCVHLFEH